MSGYGLGPFALKPYGLGGATGFSVVSARAVALNAVEVGFSELPLRFDHFVESDALYAPGWTLRVVDPFGATLRLAQWVEPAPGPAVTVFLDGTLESAGVYDITCGEFLISATGAHITVRTARFRALTAQSRVVVGTPQRGFRDIANPQTFGDIGGG